MEKKLTGKVALVTGAGRGLGRAYALHLAKLGADVVVNDINLQAAKEYNEELTAETVPEEIRALGVRSIGIEADVTDRAAVDAMFEQVEQEFGRLDILVNNAGGELRGHDRAQASITPEDDFRFIMDVNLMDTVFCCQAAARIMKRQKSGKIVNIGSQAGMHSLMDGGMTPYSVAKAGVIHYTKLLAADLGPYGINVNCIAPAWILCGSRISRLRCCWNALAWKPANRPAPILPRSALSLKIRNWSNSSRWAK